MIEAGQRGFADGLVLTGFGVAAVALTAFILIESRRRQPMLPLSLFRSRTFSVTSAIGIVINVAFYGLIFVLSLYFQDTRHYSVLLTGLAFTPMTVAILAANLLAGSLAGRAGPRMLLARNGPAAGRGAGRACSSSGPGPSYLAIVAQLVVVGFALGLIVPVMTSALLGSVDRSHSGVAPGRRGLGLLGNGRSGGQAEPAPVVLTIPRLDHRGPRDHRRPRPRPAPRPPGPADYW